MRKENIETPVEIIYERVIECPIRDRAYSFFQLVFVISGSGFQTFNGNRNSYQADDLFLLTPEDIHTFDVDKTTEFLLIRFNRSYLKQYDWKNLNHLECLLNNATNITGNIVTTQSDRVVVKSLMNTILLCMDKTDLFSEELKSYLINALLVVVAKSISGYQLDSLEQNFDKRFINIVNYIHDNIYNPEKLRTTAISEKFNISESYLGRFFKSQCDETLQDYISKYKIKLIKNRLKFSDMRINEIADEFNFNDGSHLNKFFKKHSGVSLTEYKNSVLD
ncbi:TPA: helix-turn-helix transcriptional regulator [Elizabethkingia anophelis]|nr:helix-turn-helix transcriptional regulator [Elizabethkingia anophelis]